MTTNTIVFVHGLWMTPRSWESWVDRYTSSGYRVLAPSWPGMEGEVEALRADPSPIARLGIPEIVDHYDRIIRGLDEPPIIMGHSFGGLFVQLLLDRGLGAAGVGIAPGAPRGVPKLPFSTIRALWPVLHNPTNAHKAVGLTPTQFHYAFTNTLTAEQSAPVYERYHVPGVGRVLWQGALANVNPRTPARVNYRLDDRAPLLLICGSKDHIVPPSYGTDLFNKYRHSNAVTAYQEFPGRSHYILGQDGWEEVADFALSWAAERAVASARSRAPTSTTSPGARTSPAAPR